MKDSCLLVAPVPVLLNSRSGEGEKLPNGSSEVRRPVKAGIVKEWQAYEWSFCHPDLR
ncbi:MAG: hypothetical protein R2825_20085 [Saprospiraceae bacterium]